MPDYDLFGLCLASQLSLPDLPVAEDAKAADVTVELGPVQVPDGAVPGYTVDAAGALLRIPEVADYRIERGRSVMVAPAPGAPDRNVRLYLLGSAMGAVLHQRGIVPLHANAVVVGGGAIAFMGHSGAGKSTLADWFGREGHRVLSDDICAVTGDAAGGFRVPPGLPRLRLWADALARTDRDAGGLEPSYDGVDKYDLPIAADRGEAAPLRAIYLLERAPDEGFSIERLTGAAAVHALVANTYRGGYLRLAGAQGPHLMRCAAIASAVPVFRAARAWRPDLLSAQAALLRDHAGQVGERRDGSESANRPCSPPVAGGKSTR